MTQKIIVLDRDGVINYDSENYIRTPEEWRPIPKSLKAISLLHRAGYKVALATNQSGINRGYFSEETLHAIHHKMQQAIEIEGGCIDKIFYCPHRPEDICDCRKPKPGLLQQIAAHYEISMAGVPFVGDSVRDVHAALAVGAQPVLVQTGRGQRTLHALENTTDVIVMPDLFSFVQWWLQHTP